jgi:N-acetylglutamate synthase-like GNAT family acetyltransferase
MNTDRMTVAIGLARNEDLSVVLTLLEQSGLPKDGLADHWATTLVARDDGRIVCSAALEMYGAPALLRSVAVDPALRGQGLGRRLTQAALDLALGGVKDVYLLTETAGEFFRASFGAIARRFKPCGSRTVQVGLSQHWR